MTSLVVFVQPFSVNRELAERLPGRVVVLDVAFCADTARSSYATTTLPFIEALGDRLALWVDHHDHQRHADFTGDPRFVLASRREHPAVPEMITPDLIARAGPVDTVVAHGDLDGIIAAAKFLLGGVEPYPGADADARAADSRLGEMSPRARMMDHALKADLSDDAMRQTIVRYLLSRCDDKEEEAAIEVRAHVYQEIAERTAAWAERYQVDGPLAIVDIREERQPVDMTRLLMAGQRLARVALVRHLNLYTGAPQVAVAAATDSGFDFVRLFELGGGMPTRVTLPDRRFDEVVDRLRRLCAAKGEEA